MTTQDLETPTADAATPAAAPSETADAGDPSAVDAIEGTPADGDGEPVAEVTPRPEGVPEKFWDPKAGALRTDALLKSYRELERKLRAPDTPAEEVREIQGHDTRDDEARKESQTPEPPRVPASPDEYRIEARNTLLEPDPEINARLHEAGFSQEQAQLVYDLAADYVMPLIDETAAEVEATRDAERLAAHFGGQEAWPRLARQIKTWGEANLPKDVMEVLASSYDGVIAMHQMMQAREPHVLRDSEGPADAPDEAQLTRMMRDPRYWRDRDPAFIAEVTAGFERLYGE